MISINFSNILAKDIPIIVISPGKSLQSNSVVGSDVEVIDSEIISNSNQFFIGDILDNNLNGINYFQSGGYGTVSGIQLRGQPKRYTTVYIDGVKVSDPSTPSNDYYFNNLMSGSIDRIEILKGAQSSLYGSGALAGTVQLFSKKGKEGHNQNINISSGSFNTQKFDLNFDGKNDYYDYFVGFTNFSSDGESAMRDNTEKDGYRNDTITMNYGYNLNETYDTYLVLKYKDENFEYMFLKEQDWLTEDNNTVYEITTGTLSDNNYYKNFITEAEDRTFKLYDDQHKWEFGFDETIDFSSVDFKKNSETEYVMNLYGEEYMKFELNNKNEFVKFGNWEIVNYNIVYKNGTIFNLNNEIIPELNIDEDKLYTNEQFRESDMQLERRLEKTQIRGRKLGTRLDSRSIPKSCLMNQILATSTNAASVGDCNGKVLAFRGTHAGAVSQTSSVWNAISGGWASVSATVQKYEYCVGVGVGGAQAIDFANANPNSCNNLITFGAPYTNSKSHNGNYLHLVTQARGKWCCLSRGYINGWCRNPSYNNLLDSHSVVGSGYNSNPDVVSVGRGGGCILSKYKIHQIMSGYFDRANKEGKTLAGLSNTNLYL